MKPFGADARGTVVILLACGMLSCGPRHATERFALKGGERIVFFGDSITQAGLYVSYLEAYLLTRFPGKSFTLLNHGLNGETLSGARDPGSATSRPNAIHRFARDVLAWHPDVLVACFGMNDGGYSSFDEARFLKFQDGVHRLVDRTRNEAQAALVLLTPPPFDPFRRVALDPRAKAFSYAYPAIDYDDTLAKYSRWLRTLDRRDALVADPHSAIVDHLRQRREGDVGFVLAEDGVHPNPTGHWLIAQALLLAWNAPALVAEGRINAKSLQADAGDIRDIRQEGHELRATWRTGLPLPIDPRWDRRSIEIEQLGQRLNRYRLAVIGLPAPRYVLHARLDESENDVVLGPFTREQLATGLDLTTLPEFPTVSLASQILEQIFRRRSDLDQLWRDRRDDPWQGSDSSEVEEDDPKLAELRDLCRPRDIELRLSPLPAPSH